METELLKLIAGNSVVGAVLAIALWQWIRLTNKILEIIEANTKAMQQLSDLIKEKLNC